MTMIYKWPKKLNFWCRWIGHRLVQIPDSDHILNMAYCKRCLTLNKWKNAYPCAYQTTGYNSVVTLTEDATGIEPDEK